MRDWELEENSPDGVDLNNVTVVNILAVSGRLRYSPLWCSYHTRLSQYTRNTVREAVREPRYWAAR